MNDVCQVVFCDGQKNPALLSRGFWFLGSVFRSTCDSVSYTSLIAGQLRSHILQLGKRVIPSQVLLLQDDTSLLDNPALALLSLAQRYVVGHYALFAYYRQC